MSFPFIEHVAWLHSTGAEWAARARWRGAPVWHARRAGEPLAACADLLEQAPRGPVRFLDRATLLLGFPHVHYLMLPWQTGLYSRDDWQGFAEATFSQHVGLDPQVWQVQLSSMGRGSFLCRALRILRSPKRVNKWPLRALRVGMTQSNMSTPCCTPKTRSSGVPTPIM